MFSFLSANRIVAGTGLALVLCMGQVSAQASSALRVVPASLKYSEICLDRGAHGVVLDRDWTTWTGKAVKTPANDLFDLAQEFLTGSDRVEKSTATSLKLLAYLRTNRLIPEPRIDRIEARAMLDAAEDLTTLKAGEAKLLSALDGGVMRAAFDLANLYDAGGPAGLRDAEKARTYYRIASASGDVDAQLAYARLVAADPNVPDDEKNGLIEHALLDAVQHVANGDCKYMEDIGFFYLYGDLVQQDYDLAVKWFEAFAQTGDAHIQERLGILLSSRLVTEVNYDKAMDYLESAALQGRSFAAMTVGKAYATGVGRKKDFDKAVQFLSVAASASVNEANLWLARLFVGEFGGTAQPEKAKEYYERAIAGGANDTDTLAKYGEFLAKATPVLSDQDKGFALLEAAAKSGSGRAAVLVARNYLARAKTDPSFFKQAEDYLRLGADLGRPEAAKELSKMYACGRGVPFSISAANEWSARAYSLGSSSALYEAGVALLVSADPVDKAKGRTLLRQAALRGYPAALGYVIPRYETGRDRMPLDVETAQKLQASVEANPDAAYRLATEIEEIKARVQIAANETEVAAQFQRLDELVATGAPGAYLAKAELLTDRGKGSPTELQALYKVAAETGEPRAMREYANLLLADASVDVQVGRGWLQRAAEAGDVKAGIALVDTTAVDATAQLESIVAKSQICTVDEMVTLARAFGSVVDPAATSQAQFWLASAASVVGNDADDLFKIGAAYRDGFGGVAAIPQAEQYFMRSADLGRQTALREVADGHLLGRWADASPDKAKELLLVLYRGGDISAGSKLVEAIADKQVTATGDEVLDLMRTPPVLTRPGETYLKLARLDIDGAFGNSHAQLAVEWLQRSAEAGNSNAMIRLYRAYAGGVGVAASPETAVDWLLKAADAGDPRAATQLAAAYETGFGVTVDAAKAAYWRAQSAAQTGQ